MKKKIVVIFLTFILGVVAYLTIPLPYFDEDFPKDVPIALIPNAQNKGERCKRKTIYVTEKAKQYHEGEGYQFVVNDYCANLQKELVDAIENQNIDKVRDLIAKGANPDSVDFSTFEPIYPIIKASYKKDVNLMKLLLDNGADVNQEYSCCMSSSTPLSNAVQYGDKNLVELLLERGADANYRFKYDNSWRNSIIDDALVKNDFEMAEMLTAKACKDSISCRAKSRAKKVWYFFENTLVKRSN
ncbi:MAG TPA: ankyrin repeat domain-containing protein [Pyrinomonadaceae bacterium]|nr:ankyrin repeat domain-containing protein [Pyrinomonadaceae bacterium]